MNKYLKRFSYWLWRKYGATPDEMLDILTGRYYRMHKKWAEEDNFVGHTKECCQHFLYH